MDTINKNHKTDGDNLTIQRIYDCENNENCFYILVDRLWPRGVKKDRYNIDLWAKNITPTTEIRVWFNHDPKKFGEFKEKYIKELDENPDGESFLNLVKEKMKTKKVVLLYAAKDPECNHAIILRDWIEEKLINI